MHPGSDAPPAIESLESERVRAYKVALGYAPTEDVRQGLSEALGQAQARADDELRQACLKVRARARGATPPRGRPSRERGSTRGAPASSSS